MAEKKKRRKHWRSPAEKRLAKARKVESKVMAERGVFGYSPRLIQSTLNKAKAEELDAIEKSKASPFNVNIDPAAPERQFMQPILKGKDVKDRVKPVINERKGRDPIYEPPEKPKEKEAEDHTVYKLHEIYPNKYDTDGNLIFVEPDQAVKEPPQVAEIKPSPAAGDLVAGETGGSDKLASYLQSLSEPKPLRIPKRERELLEHKQAIKEERERATKARQRAATTRRNSGSVALGATPERLAEPLTDQEQNELLRKIGGGHGKYGRGVVKDGAFALGGSPTVDKALSSEHKAARMAQEASKEAADMVAAERAAKRARHTK